MKLFPINPDGRLGALMNRRSAGGLMGLLLIGALAWASSWKKADEADLGDLGYNALRTREFRLTNNTDQSFHIERVDISCDCTEITGLPPVVPARSTVSFMARFKAIKTGKNLVHVDIQDSRGWKGKSRYVIRAGVNAPSLALGKEDYAGEMRKKGYLRAASDILLAQEGEKPLLVDIRPEEAYAQAMIPGSLNMTAKALRSAFYLKKRSLVLVDSGLAGEASLALAGKLRKDGFEKVSFLQDGLRGWQVAGGRLTGVGVAEGSHALLSSDEVRLKLRPEEWLVIDSSEGTTDRKMAAAVFGKSERVRWKGKAKPFLEEIADLAKTEKGSRRKILVLTDAGQNYALMEQAARGQKDVLVYYLEGGVGAYARNIPSPDPAPAPSLVARAGTLPEKTPFSSGVRRVSGCLTCP